MYFGKKIKKIKFFAKNLFAGHPQGTTSTDDGSLQRKPSPIDNFQNTPKIKKPDMLLF